MICKWTGWSWHDYQATPCDVIAVVVTLIQEEQAELMKIAAKSKAR